MSNYIYIENESIPEVKMAVFETAPMSYLVLARLYEWGIITRHHAGGAK